MQRTLSVIAIILIFMIYSQISAQYAVKQSAFGNGGSPIANSDYRLISTLGQTGIGSTKNQSYVSHVGFWYQSSDLVTSVEQVAEQLPKEFRLDQNYPNLFNPTTTIHFALPKASAVKLTLFNILGRAVAILVNEKLQPGEYKVVLDAKGLASGVYLYRIDAERFWDIKKIMVLK